MRASILALVLIAATNPALAGELYRWVDENGGVHYSDQPPPPDARSAERKRLGDKPGQGQVSYALQQAMKNFPVTLYVSDDCGEPCKAAASYLTRRGVPFAQKDARQEADADALRALTGGKLEVPVASVGPKVLRGYEESAWKATLDAAGYPGSATAAAPAPAQGAPAPKAEASPPKYEE
jgi:glutaredoxin